MTNLKMMTVALAATLLFPLAACSAGVEPVRAEVTTSKPAGSAKPTDPTPQPTVGIDTKTGQSDWCSGIDPAEATTTDALSVHWTADDLASAYCESLKAQGEIAWTSLALPGAAVDPAQVVETVRPWLTDRAIGQVRAMATKAIAGTGDDQADRDLGGLLGGFDLVNPEYTFRAESDPDQPVVGQRRWSPAEFNVDQEPDAAGNPRLDVVVTLSADMLLDRKIDGAAFKVAQSRRLTLAMVRTGIPDRPWLIDSWSADQTKYSRPTPDTTVAAKGGAS